MAVAEDMDVPSGKRRRIVPASGLRPRNEYAGHEAPVEDVQFQPQNTTDCVIGSVSDDRSLMLWDSRSDDGPAGTIRDLHSDDIHCLDWCPHNNALLLTGGGDTFVNLVDTRKMGGSAEV